MHTSLRTFVILVSLSAALVACSGAENIEVQIPTEVINDEDAGAAETNPPLSQFEKKLRAGLSKPYRIRYSYRYPSQPKKRDEFVEHHPATGYRRITNNLGPANDVHNVLSVFKTTETADPDDGYTRYKGIWYQGFPPGVGAMALDVVLADLIVGREFGNTQQLPAGEVPCGDRECTVYYDSSDDPSYVYRKWFFVEKGTGLLYKTALRTILDDEKPEDYVFIEYDVQVDPVEFPPAQPTQNFTTFWWDEQERLFLETISN